MNQSFQRGPLTYEGKAKRIFEVVGQPGYIWQEFKDSLTAFNGEKTGSFADKGAINREISNIIFDHLEGYGIQTHRVQDLPPNSLVSLKLKMVPLELVVRNRLAGSTAKKFNKQEGTALAQPLVEFFYKDDRLGDPFLSDQQALMLGATANEAELRELRELALTVNRGLSTLMKQAGIDLIDFKIEVGRDEKGNLLLADEISPDTCRLWDLASGDRLDKDRFRRDLGGVDSAYEEVLQRLRKVEKRTPVTAGQKQTRVASFQFEVQVMPRPEVLDAQGRAIEDLLRRQGYAIQSCKVGKAIALQIPAASLKEARSAADEIASGLLCNPLIESFSLVTLEGGR